MYAYYTDLHIHTSEDADSLNENYDVKLLVRKIKEYSGTSNILISLTDHNVINKKAYEALAKSGVNFIVGVELHIRNYPDKEPYHCHAFFDCGKDDLMLFVDRINEILDTIYPKKMVGSDDDIPSLEEISKSFDVFDYLLLPHGGQTHRTFNKSIGDNVRLDTVMERSIYFNQFDGFTSRSNKGLETTRQYFKKLGIAEFTNLITCSDNYNPSNYPQPKVKEKYEFVPTWILSEPSFSGLRLALSESMRLLYQKEKPILFKECISACKLKNEYVDIDVELTPGLNVIIGSSSSGKTLFLDSLYHKLVGEKIAPNEKYYRFLVNDLIVNNPVGYTPHYINQNYISKVLDDPTNKGVAAIGIVKSIFKGDESQDKLVTDTINSLKDCVKTLIKDVENIEKYKDDISKIPHFPRLISNVELKKNPYEVFLPTHHEIEQISFDDATKKRYETKVSELEELNKNPFIDIRKELFSIKQKIEIAYNNSKMSDSTYDLVNAYKMQFDEQQEKGKQTEIEKNNNRVKLLNLIDKYLRTTADFYTQLKKLSSIDLKYNTTPIDSKHGHHLYIENQIQINSEVIINTFNELLKKEFQIENLESLAPTSLTQEKHNKNKAASYAAFEEKVIRAIENTNKKIYRIITNDNRDFNLLSPGWKTAIILDLIFGYQNDIAPIFVDQPEDNLANTYINDGLVKAIKESKQKRQILIVTHNATIPMLADAQNVVYCENENGIIKIRSAKLENSFENETAIDCIARVTDGGKSSIKKRFKKYNLKKYREDANDNKD